MGSFVVFSVRLKLTTLSSISRRRFLQKSLLTPLKISFLGAVVFRANTAFAATNSVVADTPPAAQPQNTYLNLINAHTNDVFEGPLNRNNLAKINHVLRDHRQNQSTDMDKQLLQFLLAIQVAVNKPVQFKVFSGFRSAKTNAHLSATTTGVAKKSLHMQGRAMDICIDGMSAAQLANIARKLKLGGVGCYTRSGFVHIDTGAVRHWNG
jgi:uncharacterized protein YcbK (DUF882 family)